MIGMRAIPSILLLVMLTIPAFGDRIAEARLSSDRQEHDPVFIYERVPGSFFVENIGADPFRIANVKSTCACTTAIRTKGTVAPGERAEIQYEMESAAPLRRSVSIFVYTNPPLKEPLRFIASGTWKPVVEVDDSSLTIHAHFGDSFSQVVPLRAAEGVGSLRILDATTRQDWVELELERADDASLPALIVRSKGPIQPGSHKLGVDVSFEANLAGKQSLKFNVEVQSDFSVSPSPLTVQLSPESPQTTVEFVVRSKRGERFVIQGIQAERIDVAASDFPRMPSASHRVQITVHPADGPVPRRGRLLIDLGENRGILPVEVYLLRPSAPAR